MVYDAHVYPAPLLPKAKEIIFVIVQTVSPFGNTPKGLFYFPEILKSIHTNY